MELNDYIEKNQTKQSSMNPEIKPQKQSKQGISE